MIYEKGFIYDLLSHMIKAMINPTTGFLKPRYPGVMVVCLNPSIKASEPRKLTI